MAEQNGEKTQDPTPHRRQQARQKGQVAQSQDLASAALLVLAGAAMLTMSAGLGSFLLRLVQRQLGGEAWRLVDRRFVSDVGQQIQQELAQEVGPLLLLFFLAALVVSVGQTGLMFVPERLRPDWSRVSPLAGIKRLVSLTAVMRLVFGLFKVGVIFTVTAIVLYNHRAELLGLAELELVAAAAVMGKLVLTTLLWCGFALLIIALADYAYQRWKHEQDLKMTPQEVREEMKNLEGDPQIMARRRAVQRQMVMNRLADAVPKADVVVTNPTELAIAIQYDPLTMAAPIVLAKGAGLLAQRIRKLALEHGIPIVERKPLAQLLYREVDVNRPVPDESYAAVAEVLAYVYQLKGKKIPGTDAA